MKANINNTDKYVRIILAIVLALLTFTHIVKGTAAIILLIIALALVATAVINFCPVWHILGISTRKEKTPKKEEEKTE